MVEFWEIVVAFSLKLDSVFPHHSLAEKRFFSHVFNKKKALVAEENLDLQKWELLKYHKYFSILVFEGILPIEIAL